PGATTSGLNRTETPSRPTPTFPRAEKEATWLELSVNPCQTGKLLPSSVTSFVMLRRFSQAPTVITFLAVPGARMNPGKLPNNSVSTGFPLPAAKTRVNGCDPGTPGKASRAAASQI